MTCPFSKLIVTLLMRQNDAKLSFRSKPSLARTYAETFTLALCYIQGRSQDFSKGGAEVMEAKALKRKNCL